jgi:hypothetical protein
MVTIEQFWVGSVNYRGVAKIGQFGGDSSATLRAMTTKTIPEYLEDERQKQSDDQLRIKEEAARIQPLHNGHHRTAKQPQLELAYPVQAAAKARKAAASARKQPRAARKTTTKVRKTA